MIESIISSVLEQFDFSYCISVNILTYLLINLIINIRGNKDVGTWIKRSVLLCSIIILGVAYYNFGNNSKVIINSSILSPVFWSWVMKPICKKFKIDYKQLSLFE